MTNLEAADLLDNLIGMVSDNHDSDYDEALSKGRDILKSEPCGDATLKDIFCMGCEYKEQEPKTGHWKKIATYPLYECSKCKLESMLNTWDYCPNCGCRMVEPQESEVEE